MNGIVMHADSMENIRPLSNGERRAAWASRYYSADNPPAPGFVFDHEPPREPAPATSH